MRLGVADAFIEKPSVHIVAGLEPQARREEPFPRQADLIFDLAFLPAGRRSYARARVLQRSRATFSIGLWRPAGQGTVVDPVPCKRQKTGILARHDERYSRCEHDVERRRSFQRLSFRSRYRDSLCVFVPAVQDQFSRSRGNDGGTWIVSRSYDDHSPGPTLCSRIGKAVEPLRSASITITGIELMHRIRKGQFKLGSLNFVPFCSRYRTTTDSIPFLEAGDEHLSRQRLSRFECLAGQSRPCPYSAIT